MSGEDKPTNNSISSEEDVRPTDEEEETPPMASSTSFNDVIPSDDPVNHQKEELANESESPLNPSSNAEPLIEDDGRSSTSSSSYSNDNNEPPEPEPLIPNLSLQSNLCMEMIIYIRQIQAPIFFNIPKNMCVKMVSRIKRDSTFNISVECGEIPLDETKPENSPGSSNATRNDSRSAVSSDFNDRQENVDIRQPQENNEPAVSSSTLDTCETKTQETDTNPPTTEDPSSSVSSNVNQSAKTDSMSNTSKKKSNEASSSKLKKNPLTEEHEINEVKQCVTSVLEFLISSLNSTASNRERVRAITNVALETIITIEEEIEEPTLVSPNENQETQNGPIQPNQHANLAENSLDSIPSTSSNVVNSLNASDGTQNQEPQPRNQSTNASCQSNLDNFQSNVVDSTIKCNRSQARSRILNQVPVSLNINRLVNDQFANILPEPYIDIPSLRNTNMPFFGGRRRNLHQHALRPKEEEINKSSNSTDEDNGDEEEIDENQPSMNSNMSANTEDLFEIDLTSISSSNSFSKDEYEEGKDEEAEDTKERDDENNGGQIGLKEKFVEPQSLQKSSGSTKADEKSDAHQPEENYDALNNTVVNIEQPVQENQSTVDTNIPVGQLGINEIDLNSNSSLLSLIVDIKKKECMNTQIIESPNNSTPTDANSDTHLPSQKNDTSNTAIENDEKPAEENVHTFETNISTNQLEATNVTSPKSIIVYKDEEVHMNIQSLLFEDATASSSTNPDNRQSKRKYKTTIIPSAFKVEQKQKRLCMGSSKSNVASEKSESSNKPAAISTNSNQSELAEMVSNTASLSNITNTPSDTEVNLASDQQQKLKEDNTQNATTANDEKSSSEEDQWVIHETMISDQEDVIDDEESPLPNYIIKITKNKKSKSAHRSQPSTSTSSSSNTYQSNKGETYDNSSSDSVHKKTSGKNQPPIPTDPLKPMPDIIEIDSDVEYLPRSSVIASPFEMNTSKPSTSSSSYSETRQSKKNNSASNFPTSNKFKQKHKYQGPRNDRIEEEDIFKIGCEPYFPDYPGKVAKPGKKYKKAKEPQPSTNTASCAYRPKKKKKTTKKTVSSDQEDSKARSYSYDSLANREEMIEIDSDSLSITSTVPSNDETDGDIEQDLQMDQSVFTASYLNARWPSESDDTSNNTSADENQ